MRFAIPMGSFAEVLRTQKVLITVGGVSEYLEPRTELEALRDLVSRVGAGAPAAAAGGGASRLGRATSRGRWLAASGTRSGLPQHLRRNDA